MNPLSAILAAPAAAAAAGSLVGAATRTASETATSFAEALTKALTQRQDTPSNVAEGTTAPEDLDRLQDLAFELSLLAEAAGCAETPPQFRVTPADGQIEVVADDPAQQAALERLLAARPDLLEKLVAVAQSCCERCDEGTSVELSLDVHGELTAQTLSDASEA